MAHFSYSARGRDGNPLRGNIEADSLNDAADRLLRQGIVPVDITALRQSPTAAADLTNLFKRRRISLVDMIFFTRQLRTLLRAGVPIGDALYALFSSNNNAQFAAILRDMHKQLQSGKPLSQALRTHSDIFSPIYTNLVEVGETTGKLPEVFASLGGYLAQEKEIRDRIAAAVRYPVMVLGMIAVAFVIVNVLVIPAFAGMFAKFNAKLPLATRILIETSRLSKEYWWLWIATIYGVIRWAKATLKSPKGRRKWDEYKLKLPILGRIFLHGALARFSKAFALTISAGVPMSTGLGIVARAVDNEFIADKILQMRVAIEGGKSLSQSIKSTNLFPPLVIQMVIVGEQTGQFEQLIGEVADFYATEMDQDLKSLGSRIEPILLVVIGIFVMLLMMGIFMPLWDMVNAAQRRG